MSSSPLDQMYPVSGLLAGSDKNLRCYSLGRCIVVYSRERREWWLDGAFGEFVKMDNRGGELRIAWDADHEYHPVSWAEVCVEYRAQALMLVCPD